MTLGRYVPEGFEKVAFLSVTALKSPASELLPRVTKLTSENGKNRGTTVPAMNFSHLIPPLVFNTSDLYHVVML